MLTSDFSFFVFLTAVALTGWAALIDVRDRRIPNPLVAAIAGLYPAYLMASPAAPDWLGAVAVAAIVLGLGFALYVLGVMGAGDSKLLAAGALWAGPGYILDFLAITTLAGGVMAVTLWLHHRLQRAGGLLALGATPAEEGFIRRSMPYGVAIATGAIFVAAAALGAN